MAWRLTLAAKASLSTLVASHFNAFTRRSSPVLPNHLSTLIAATENLIPSATVLSKELVRASSDSVAVIHVLHKNSDYLIRSRELFVQLLNELYSYPSLGIEVFNWKRWYLNFYDSGANTMNAHEYSKAIGFAGKTKRIFVALNLFMEAEEKGVKTTSTYNALMSAYLFNELHDACYSLFLAMKSDKTCLPSIVSYNIIIDNFGRLMELDTLDGRLIHLCRMEEIFKEINELQLLPSIFSYNGLINGYIKAKRWADMENTFQVIKSSPLEPNLTTYKLMIRGYADSGNISKMEETYICERDSINSTCFSLIRVMIVAYSKSAEPDRVNKVKGLSNFLKGKEYRPWMNLLLIRFYARLDSLENMEYALTEAFVHNTKVTTEDIMNLIIVAFYRGNALESLETFGRDAAVMGWQVCRSLYHCKMALYGSRMNFKAMKNVIAEMKAINMSVNRKTWWILHKAYSAANHTRCMVLGQIFKRGYYIPKDAFPPRYAHLSATHMRRLFFGQLVKLGFMDKSETSSSHGGLNAPSKAHLAAIHMKQLLLGWIIKQGLEDKSETSSSHGGVNALLLRCLTSSSHGGLNALLLRWLTSSSHGGLNAPHYAHLAATYMRWELSEQSVKRGFQGQIKFETSSSHGGLNAPSKAHLGWMIKQGLEDKSETSSSHGGLNAPGAAPVP